MPNFRPLTPALAPALTPALTPAFTLAFTPAFTPARRPAFTLTFGLALTIALTAALSLCPLGASAAPGALVTTPQVRAELLAHAPEGVGAGKPLWLGLRIDHQPRWHTYWKNPGDSGLPTTLKWTLPAGVAAGDIQWPTPGRLPIGPLMNYGYDGTLLLPVAVTVPAGFDAESLSIQLRADWLVCKDVCIPEGGDFVLQLPAQAATAGHAALFEAARAALPQPVAGAQATGAVEGQSLVLRIAGLPAEWHGKTLGFLPETTGVIHNAALPVSTWKEGVWTARVALDPHRSESPQAMPAVLTRAGQAAGLQVQIALTTPWPAAAALPAPLPSLGEAQIRIAPAADLSLALALVLALAGGALLNLMPCVFPVLSLKVLGFASHAHDRRGLLAGGLAYTAGVVLSFVALAALLLALRAGGEQLGWGFQLQSPAVVAVLAALFTLIGLNLAGVFEFGSVLPSSWAAARARHPIVDSFLTGVLAVAVASPCTAPFMGASLGAAVALPSAQGMAVFAALGLGMALPYLVASAWPAVARLLPRPGVWMLHFRTAMAFPMFATVVWLVWVLGVQVGVDGVAALLALLLALAFAAWALGSPALGRRARRLWRGGAGVDAGRAGVGRARAAAGSRGADDHVGRGMAALVARAGGAGAGRRPARLCGLHRRLVRDVPVQQTHHARLSRGGVGVQGQKCAAAARRLDAARRRHQRRAGPPGPQRGAGVLALHPWRRSASNPERNSERV